MYRTHNELDNLAEQIDQETDEVLHFKDLNWRLEVITDSRAIRGINKPRILMQLKLQQPNGDETLKYLITDPANLFNFKDNIEDALLESNSNQMLKIIRHMK